MPILIEQTPASMNIVMAYRPVAMRITLTVTEASLPRAPYIEACKATVYWNGVEVGVLRKDWNTRTENPATTWVYEYDVDVQRLVQDNLLPKRGVKSGVFGTLGESRRGDVPSDASGTVQVDYEFYYRDTDNLLKLLSGGAESSDDLICVPFSLPQEVRQDLWGDGNYIYQITEDIVKPLTNIPVVGANVSLIDNGWLSFILTDNWNDINAYRVRFFNSAGGQMEYKTMYFPSWLGLEKQIVTIGSGVIQINLAVSETLWYYQFSGMDADLLDATVDHYKIDFGYVDPVGIDGNFNGRSVSVRYNIRNVVESRSFRLHFLNRLGGGDAFTFDCKRRRNINVGSTSGKKGLSWNLGGSEIATNDQHNREDGGAFRYDIKSGVSYELESKILDDTEVRWLEELSDSMETYLEDQINGQLIRVKLDDVEGFLTEDSEEFGMVMRCSLTMSNDVIRQRL